MHESVNDLVTDGYGVFSFSFSFFSKLSGVYKSNVELQSNVTTTTRRFGFIILSSLLNVRLPKKSVESREQIHWTYLACVMRREQCIDLVSLMHNPPRTREYS